MQWFPVFFALYFCDVVYAEDATFDDAVDNYLSNCKRNMEEKGNMMMAYFYINPHTFGRIPSFDVADFRAYSEPDDDKATSEVLLKTACICTKVAINSYDFIVVPFIFNGTTKDALTLCVFHDDYTKHDDVLDFPDHLLSSWMHAQYIARMPRTLIAPADKSSSADCVDLNGNPTAVIPNQKACYYVNYAVFEEVDGKVETIVKNAYYGPFLGSQYPDYAMLQGLAKSDTPVLDFMTEFDYVLCSLIKTRSWLLPSDYKTGCRHKVYNNAKKVVIYGCCCLGHDDPNCSEVTEAVKNNRTLCLDGTLSGGATSFYFALQCPFTAVKKYDRMGLDTFDGSFEHRQALTITSDPAVKFDKSWDCSTRYTSECKDVSVDVIHDGCCSGNAFCSLQAALASNIQRCRYSYGENQETSGCSVVFYRANNQWVRSSTVWFEMDKMELVHLYTSQTASTVYDVSLAFLINKNVDESCPEQTHRYDRQYYVVNCAARSCDYDFDDNFFNFLHESIVNKAIDETAVPRCETGSLSYTTDATEIHELPPIDSTHEIGLYCKLDLQIRSVRNRKVVDIVFGHVFPMPDNCNKAEGRGGDRNLTCCYTASSNVSYVEPGCHTSNVMSIVNNLDKEKKTEEEAAVTLNPDEPVQKLPQDISEIADKCDQSNIGHVGKVTRRCYPGGHGCFHLNGLNDTNEAVIASCIGRAEDYIATRKDAFDRYHEALICLVEEAKDKCHLVQSGTRMRYLCCCSSTETRNNMARCKTDSNMMFNTYQYDVKYIGDFKDEY